jgi:hypothetical protein
VQRIPKKLNTRTSDQSKPVHRGPAFVWADRRSTPGDCVSTLLAWKQATFLLCECRGGALPPSRACSTYFERNQPEMMRTTNRTGSAGVSPADLRSRWPRSERLCWSSEVEFFSTSVHQCSAHDAPVAIFRLWRECRHRQLRVSRNQLRNRPIGEESHSRTAGTARRIRAPAG